MGDTTTLAATGCVKLKNLRGESPVHLKNLSLLNPGPHSGPYSLKYLFARFQAKPKDFWKSHRYRAFWG